jgi:hypothetical protein
MKPNKRRKRTRTEQRERRARNTATPEAPAVPERTPMLDFPQSTLEEIWQSESRMLEKGRERYGNYWVHARGCTVFLSRCITEIDHSRMMFGYLFSHMKKYHTLTLFSVMRLHRVQAMMDLRQVLEAGASAAFAIGNPGQEHFVDVTEDGILDPSQPLTRKRYAWLEANYREKSDWLKSTKDGINSWATHANLITANSVFTLSEAGDFGRAPFFDIEDDYLVKGDLWQLSNVALHIMDLLYRVNESYKAVRFIDNFEQSMSNYVSANNALLDEIKQSERYKAIEAKLLAKGALSPKRVPPAG